MHELTEEELALLADEASVDRPVRRGRKPGRKPGDKGAGTSHDHRINQPAGAAEDPVVEMFVEAPVEASVETLGEPPAEIALNERDEVRGEYREQAPTPVATRGPHTPAQYDDDGWGDLPVQMRS